MFGAPSHDADGRNSESMPPRGNQIRRTHVDVPAARRRLAVDVQPHLGDTLDVSDRCQHRNDFTAVHPSTGRPASALRTAQERIKKAIERVLRRRCDRFPGRIGGEVKAPSKIRDVKPAYPAIARDARVQGVVIVEAIIDATGRVADTRVLRSIPLLDEAAVEAVRQWEFTPTQLNGTPQAVVMTVTVNFTVQ